MVFCFLWQPEWTEWVTIVECICSNRSATHPLVIFKRDTTVQMAWIPFTMNKDWSWTCNTKGWTCDHIGEEWIKRCFEPLTQTKLNGHGGKHLICNGCGSYITAQFIWFCMDHNILVLLYLYILYILVERCTGSMRDGCRKKWEWWNKDG